LARGEGAYLVSREGRRYIDYVMSYGPLILGHAHPRVVEAATRAAAEGLSFGVPTEREVVMAELLASAVPGVETVRMVNSGTEATMSALRLARAVTGRKRVVKFEGCYHGHHDALLVKAGSGAATSGVPDSAGVPQEMAGLTILAPYNDLAAVEAIFAERADDIAAVIVEPVAGNMGTVPPQPGFLEGLRALTAKHGSLLIFDEVMTGFRVAWGGAARRYGIVPDLVTLAKVIGAGMPVGAYGGRREWMRWMAPVGPVYQAGTLSGNPVAMAAGLAQLQFLQTPGFYEDLEAKTRYLAAGLAERARRHRVAATASAVGGMFSLCFAERAPQNFAEVAASDRRAYAKWFHGMLERGVFFPPSPFETAFPSWAHGSAEMEAVLAAADEVFARW
jgi:glutamate-1-semialdehyde 2,1-aminomutase